MFVVWYLVIASEWFAVIRPFRCSILALVVSVHAVRSFWLLSLSEYSSAGAYQLCFALAVAASPSLSAAAASRTTQPYFLSAVHLVWIRFRAIHYSYLVKRRRPTTWSVGRLDGRALFEVLERSQCSQPSAGAAPFCSTEIDFCRFGSLAGVVDGGGGLVCVARPALRCSLQHCAAGETRHPSSPYPDSPTRPCTGIKYCIHCIYVTVCVTHVLFTRFLFVHFYV